MISRLAAAITPYLPLQLHREVRELYVSVGILDFAVAAVQLFEPIYLWTLGYSLQQILLFYIIVYVAYFFLLPIGANIARTKGFEHAILFSSPFLVLYYLSLFSLADHPFLFYVAPLAFAIQKTLYWPGYHADFARYGENVEGGREVSNILAIINGVSILGPVVGGTILHLFGFPALFLMITALILASNVPLFFTREVFTPHPLAYRELYRRVVGEPEDRRRFFASAAWGEELITLVIWPIFIYLFFKNFLSFGAVLSASVLATTLLILAIGKVVDTRTKVGVLNLGTLIAAAAWLLRVFAQGPANVLVLDTLGRVGKQIITVPHMAIIYERARRGEHVMTTVATFELGLIAGKILAATILFFLFTLIPDERVQFSLAFLLAAAFSLLYARRRRTS